MSNARPADTYRAARRCAAKGTVWQPSVRLAVRDGWCPPIATAYAQGRGSRYMPHQSLRECSRRAGGDLSSKQVAKIAWRATNATHSARPPRPRSNRDRVFA